MGYGDNTTKNNIEYTYSLIFMIIGGYLASMTVGGLINSFKENKSPKSVLFYQTITMETFCDNSNINKDIKDKIKK